MGKPKCFCGRTDVVAWLGKDRLCEWHNKLYTYYPVRFREEREKYVDKQNDKDQGGK